MNLRKILAVNAGSSSLKFATFPVPMREAIARGAEPIAEPIGAQTTAAAVGVLIKRLTESGVRIDAVGCRVVHGGPWLAAPARVTAELLTQLRAVEPLAPLHNPIDVAILEGFERWLPEVPAVAVFDTAFHRNLPDVARTYALPVELATTHGLRRYGFHGLSHAYVSRRLLELIDRAGDAKGTRLVTCHLGNGASVCAIRDGKSIDTSMGFTPMEGLVMGTRSGDLDPGLVLFLLRATGKDAAEVGALLNHQSGLAGLSGLGSDLRAIEQAAATGDARAELALEVFAYRAAKYIGAYVVALEGLDAMAFTGGIGEHSASMRERICRRLGVLGIELDSTRNRGIRGDGPGATGEIGAAGGAVPVWVIPTDEEIEIARAVAVALAL